jgi:hypothetical protein
VARPIGGHMTAFRKDPTDETTLAELVGMMPDTSLSAQQYRLLITALDRIGQQVDRVRLVLMDDN